MDGSSLSTFDSLFSASTAALPMGTAVKKSNASRVSEILSVISLVDSSFCNRADGTSVSSLNEFFSASTAALPMGTAVKKSNASKVLEEVLSSFSFGDSSLGNSPDSSQLFPSDNFSASTAALPIGTAVKKSKASISSGVISFASFSFDAS